MKIRLGFVSNSSSASFVLTIEMKLCDLLEKLVKGFKYSLFNRETINKLLEKTIKTNTEYLESSWNKEQSQIIIDLNVERLSKIDSMSDSDLVTLALDIYGLSVGPFTDNTSTISGWTSMFNDYDDVPDELHKISSMLTAEGISNRLDVHEEN